MITSWFTSWKLVDDHQLIYQLKTSRWLPVDLPVENQLMITVDLPIENQ